ncbi:MAG: ATP-binding cassette domain-containing protein [Oligoflexales bacterium]|nr:ATP-binding cassette domain-containing protein [Oligoflexales bacterium]
MLEIRDLELEVNKKRITKPISFDIPCGELTCLSGPSGVGKTTLIRTIAGLHKAGSGTISVNGVCFVKDGKELVPCHLRKVGYAPQEPSLYPHMTVKENLSFFLRGLNLETQTKRIESVIEQLQITDKVDCYPHQLSGGQAQRVAIARAIVNDPQILLFDETLSGIHTELAIKVGQIILKMVSEKNIPGILVSHDLELTKKISPNTCVLNSQGLKRS